MSDQNFVELSWVFAVIRRWWWLITSLALLAAVITFAVTSITPPVYESSVTLLVNPSKNSNTNQYNDLMASAQLALTYSKMLKDRPVLETTISNLGLKTTPAELAKHITAEPISNTQLIQLTVTDSDPERASLIANSMAKVFAKRIVELSAERYAGTIKNAEDRVNDFQLQLKDLQAQSDSFRSQKVAKNVALANKQISLDTLQNNYQSLQNSYQDLQLTVAEVTGKVYIVEPVQVETSQLQDTSSASAVISVNQQSTSSNQSDDRLALTYGRLMVKPPLLERVIKELGLVETTDQLSNKISVELVTGTQLIQLKVTDPDGLKAQLIAQSLVNAFVAQVKALLVEPYTDRLNSIQKQMSDNTISINNTQAEIATLTAEIAQLSADLDRMDTTLVEVRTDYRASQQRYEQLQTTAAETSDAVVITEPAQIPKNPSQNRLVYIVLATLIGAAIGTGLAFLLKYADDRIRTQQDVYSALKLPVLSMIGKFTKRGGELVMDSAPASLIAEDFRVLSTYVRLLTEKQSIRTLLVTSPTPSAGKSVIVSNLAFALARTGLNVIAVDADLRKPRLHKIFKLAQGKGLSDSLLAGDVNGSLHSTQVVCLKVLTSGGATSHPAEDLGSPNLSKLFEELSGKADLILVDCPPVLSAADAAILASHVDGVLLVLRFGHTESQAAQSAVESLRQVGANLLGVVLNASPQRRKGYYN